MRWVSALLGLGLAAGVACGDSSGSVRVLDDWPDECRGNPDFGRKLPDHVAVANEIMFEKSDDLLVDGGQRDRLADEVASIIERVGEELPPETVVLAPPQARLQVIIGLTGRPAERLKAQAEDAAPRKDIGYSFFTKTTGDQQIDQLSARLGILAMRVTVIPGLDTVTATLCLDDRVNAALAADAYESLENVYDGSINGFGYITWVPGINIRQMGDDWYVATVTRERQACLYVCEAVASYFIADATSVRAVPAEEAESQDLFVRLHDLARIGFAR